MRSESWWAQWLPAERPINPRWEIANDKKSRELLTKCLSQRWKDHLKHGEDLASGTKDSWKPAEDALIEAMQADKSTRNKWEKVAQALNEQGLSPGHRTGGQVKNHFNNQLAPRQNKENCNQTKICFPPMSPHCESPRKRACSSGSFMERNAPLSPDISAVGAPEP